VFRNDPASMADEFRRCLLDDPAFDGAFDRVVFAVLDRSPGRRFIAPFETAFSASR